MISTTTDPIFSILVTTLILILTLQILQQTLILKGISLLFNTCIRGDNKTKIFRWKRLSQVDYEDYIGELK